MNGIAVIFETDFPSGIFQNGRVASAALLFLILAICGCNGRNSDDSGLDEAPIGILLQPEQIVVPVGTDAQLTAIGLFEDRSSLDITHLVNWSSTNEGVATASNSLDSEGVITGAAVGDAKVTAKISGVVSNEVTVSVTDAQLVGLTVEPREVDVATGEVAQLKAIAAYSDGNRADSSSQVRWITSDGGVATVDAAGLITGAGAGTATVHADWNGTLSETCEVRVIGGASSDLSVSGASGETAGGYLTLTVEVANSGTSGASNYFVDVFMDPSGTPSVGDFGDDYDLVSYTGASSTSQLTFTMAITDGYHEIYILADSEDTVDESNESNNGFLGSITASSGGGDSGPNLEITYFDYSSTAGTLYYFVDVTNTGGEDVGQFYVDLFVDSSSEPVLYDDGDDYTTVDSLAAGATVYADFTFESEDCYYCESWVMIDGYDYVEETDETDNVDGPIYVWTE